MNKSILSLLLITTLVVVGCAEEKKSKKKETPPVVEVPDGPYVPPGSGPGQGPGDNFQFGGSVEFVPKSLDRMMDYASTVLYDPQDIILNVNLVKAGSGYGGVVTLSYTDQGEKHLGYFGSGTSKKEVKYNIWFQKDGKKVWHGFFEDFIGAIVVVIDEVVDLGDGGGIDDKVNGSVWFKNFEFTYAPHPPTRCWFVSLGPYDCRAWKSGQGVNTTEAVNPDRGYKKLGTFIGLSVKDAFNGEFEF